MEKFAKRFLGLNLGQTSKGHSTDKLENMNESSTEKARKQSSGKVIPQEISSSNPTPVQAAAKNAESTNSDKTQEHSENNRSTSSTIPIQASSVVQNQATSRVGVVITPRRDFDKSDRTGSSSVKYRLKKRAPLPPTPPPALLNAAMDTNVEDEDESSSERSLNEKLQDLQLQQQLNVPEIEVHVKSSPGATSIANSENHAEQIVHIRCSPRTSDESIKVESQSEEPSVGPNVQPSVEPSVQPSVELSVEPSAEPSVDDINKGISDLSLLDEHYQALKKMAEQPSSVVHCTSEVGASTFKQNPKEGNEAHGVELEQGDVICRTTRSLPNYAAIDMEATDVGESHRSCENFNLTTIVHETTSESYTANIDHDRVDECTEEELGRSGRARDKIRCRSADGSTALKTKPLQHNPAEPIYSEPSETPSSDMAQKRKSLVEEQSPRKRLSTTSPSASDMGRSVSPEQLYEDSPERNSCTRSSGSIQQAAQNLQETTHGNRGKEFNSDEHPEASRPSGHQQSYQVSGSTAHPEFDKPSDHQQQSSKSAEVKGHVDPHHEFVSTSVRRIKSVLKEVQDLQEEMESFLGTEANDRDYVYMDEVMMRSLIKLDNLETKNDPEVRKKRKEGIQFIQRMMLKLDDKLRENQEELKRTQESEGIVEVQEENLHRPVTFTEGSDSADEEQNTRSRRSEPDSEDAIVRRNGLI